MAEGLQVEVRTPQKRVLDAPAHSVQVPTETGLVGLRPRGEPQVLAFEAGLVVLRTEQGDRFVATAGGLLEAERTRCVLYTPFATVGESEMEMEQALQQLLSSPPAELVARQRLQELEQRIVTELAHHGPVPTGGDDG
jgi:F0F1-type ATP synthase epsilon subunit